MGGRVTTLAAAIVLAAGLGVNTAAAQAIPVKIAHATVNDVQDEWSKRYKARLEQKSGGRFQVQVFPLSQLGITPRQIEGLQLGTIEFMAAPPQFMVGVDPRFQVLAAPGMFTGMEHAQRTLSDPRVREAALGLGTAKGLIGVTLIIYGPSGFQTKEPLATPEALRAKKIRVLASEIEIEPVKHFGGSAVPMPLGELMAALQQGVVDGSSTSLTVAAAFKMYSVAKYHTEARWQIHPTAGFVSKVWFDKLPADLQKIVMEEGKAVEQELFGWMLDHQTRARADWEKNGGVWSEWRADQHPQMLATVASIADRILAKDAGSKQLYDLITGVAREKP